MTHMTWLYCDGVTTKTWIYLWQRHNDTYSGAWINLPLWGERLEHTCGSSGSVWLVVFFEFLKKKIQIEPHDTYDLALLWPIHHTPIHLYTCTPYTYTHVQNKLFYSINCTPVYPLFWLVLLWRAVGNISGKCFAISREKWMKFVSANSSLLLWAWKTW